MFERCGGKEMESNDKKYIEVWEDVVDMKDLVLSLIICSITTMGGYFLAPNDETKPLIFGLIGTVIGFIICTVIFKPKRTFEYIEEEE